MITTDIDALVRDRPKDLDEARSSGTKIVGYFPGGYVPEELIYAAGAIPLCLAHGGDAHKADEGLALLPSVICPFARAQVGEMLLKTNPFYSMLDLVVVPSTCQHMKKVGDVWEHYGDVEIFKLGVPYQCEDDFELEYYKDRLLALRARLEVITGASITDAKLGKAISLYNRLRELLRTLSLTRRGRLWASDSRPAICRTPIYGVPINTLDFVRLQHASLYVDPAAMVAALEAIHRDLSEVSSSGGSGRPRLLLMGPNLAYGDHEVLRMIGEAGADVVIEEIFEGLRDYWYSIDQGVAPSLGGTTGGGVTGAASSQGDPSSGGADLMEVLARGYLLGKRPATFMRGSTRKRLEFVLQLIQDFDVAGVLWYQLICCEFYDQESYYFEKALRDRGIPMLMVESDYRTQEMGPARTRMEAFVEMIAGGPANA